MNIQVPEIMEGLVTELVQQCSGANGATRLEAFKLWLKSAPKLLKFVRSVPVPAVVRFVASEVFGENNPAGIKFCLGGNFRENFLGKTELNVPAGELNIHELTKASLDVPIRKELTPEFEETQLAHFYEVLKNNTSGWFVAYIHDINGNLWAVNARWYATDRGWDVHADSVTDPVEWYAGLQVISRKFIGV